jgi:integrase/recombinase XerD
MTEQAISPLRRRMIEDMTIRKFAHKTQHDYVQRVKEFASYLKRSPDTAKPEDVRGFQLHLTSRGAGTPKINATVAALRFFFRVTLDRPDLARYLSTIHEPRKAPVIVSPDEMARFLEAAPGIKYKAAPTAPPVFTATPARTSQERIASDLHHQPTRSTDPRG